MSLNTRLLESSKALESLLSFILTVDKDNKIGKFTRFTSDDNGNNIISDIIFWFKNSKGIICIPFCFRLINAPYYTFSAMDSNRIAITKDNIETIKGILSAKLLEAINESVEINSKTSMEVDFLFS